ncbi:Chromosomal replication initiator protein DnaA [Acididesulfobacillus acetoxydans]|uniref:ATPase involved in DNA replication initiation n=1 Tax=Acididesulfobacillus acetoxydans TaxID=1561005 RepID=A0A8S0VWU8_9FIRM|nr:DnaA/Hda family protein [Acididesulfobacillus acetoxydans]CAA7601253.1 Chromosomal replication initiator protein DnaA [Acididesulfobacillus acetoxydans]CEJ08468.1 ATPase involved in DNA replication initiation [Acididesulfobacillus acetoxydans]
MKFFVSDFNVSAWQAVKGFTPEKWPQVTLLYGPPGTGKSTLLHLFYRRALRSERGSVLAEARRFARDYALAAQESALGRFRRYYRTAPYLFLDDLQVLSGKKKTIEELLHTFEHRLEYEYKVFVTLESEKPDLEFLGRRLASRFLSGLTLPLYQPKAGEIRDFIRGDLAQRLALVEPALVDGLAERAANLTEAKNLIREFGIYIDQRAAAFTLEGFREFWQVWECRQKTKPVPRNVIRITSQVTGIPAEEILGSGRPAPLVEARHLAMYAVREICGCGYAEIGRIFGKEHGAVIRACRSVAVKLEKNEDLRERFRYIGQAFASSGPDGG